MQTTFEDKLPHPDEDAQRRVDNAVKAEKGEAQIGGSAGRQQVANKEREGECFHSAGDVDRSLSIHPLAPLEHDTVSGGPGSQSGNPVKDPVT